MRSPDRSIRRWTRLTIASLCLSVVYLACGTGDFPMLPDGGLIACREDGGECPEDSSCYEGFCEYDHPTSGT